MDRTLEELAGYSLPSGEGDGISANRVKLFVVLAVLVGAFVYLSFVAFQSATRYYYTVAELQEIGPSETGQVLRVNGKLVPGSFVRQEGSTMAKFSLTDGEATLTAFLDGVVPDLFFNEHSEIVLEGIYEPDGTFQSQQMTVKCPSKYVAAG
jgi:cytochrome c-type biogenesis protein CcmE